MGAPYSPEEETCANARHCYNARSSCTLMFPHDASERRCSRGCVSRRCVESRIIEVRLAIHRERSSAFTLLELLIVVGIIAVLLVLMAPAFTSLKSAGDVTSAAYTIKGVLDTARTYAKANNTYTWVGFYEENTTDVTPTNNIPAYPGRGRVLLATVASKDGTKIFEDTDPAASLPPDRIRQVGKLV
jgi:prepilin-type N-terminal cleavage/methylation domain-containing protein